MSDALARQIESGDSDHSIDPQAAAMGVLAMLDRFHNVREFVRQPVDDAALDTLATIVHRALFDVSRQGQGQGKGQGQGQGQGQGKGRMTPHRDSDGCRDGNGKNGHAAEVGRPGHAESPRAAPVGP
jgi:hypothetical protein